jgi:hypothetical protein
MNAKLSLIGCVSEGALRARAALCVVLLALFCTVAFAEGLEGRFEVRSADLGLKDGVYHMNARLELPVSAAVKQGLADGVRLSLQLELLIERERRLLPNANVAELTQRYQLQYNAVSARYVLRNVNSGEQESFATVDDALARMSQVRDVPVLDKSFIEPQRHYDASVRAKLDYGAVPLTVRILMFWVGDWHRESEWYTWTLQN